MKKFGQIIILLVAAVAVFFTGAGVTIVDYCCSSCSGQTLFIVEEHACCERASLDIAEVKSCCASEESAIENTCENGYATSSHCTASRLSIDIDSSSFRPNIPIPFNWISEASFLLFTEFLPSKIYCTHDYVHFKSPPDISPQDYLSLIRVLII